MSGLVKSMICRIYGVVQGVGFRPFVSRIAKKYHISGSVINKGSFVEVVAQGSDKKLEAFFAALSSEAPERADIVNVEKLWAMQKKAESFEIAESKRDSGVIFIPPEPPLNIRRWTMCPSLWNGVSLSALSAIPAPVSPR